MPRPGQAHRGTRATRTLGRAGFGVIALGLLLGALGAAWSTVSPLVPSRETVGLAFNRIWSSSSTRRIAGLAGAIAVICGFCWLMQRNLRTQERHQIDPGRIELSVAPAWLKPEMARRIKGEIEDDLRAELAHLPPSDAFDPELPAKVHEALSRSAWVRRVESVQRRFPENPQAQAELVPHLEIRTPVLCVVTDEAWVLVDQDGVRLPLCIKTGGKDSQAEFEALLAGLVRPIRIVEGVKSKPPQAGKKWSSEEIVAAISMEQVLRECAMDAVLPITRMKLVGVPEHANARGRVSYAPGGGVVLLPDAQVMPDTFLVWGRPPAHAGTLEPSVNEKLSEIKRLLKDPPQLVGKAVDLSIHKTAG